MKKIILIISLLVLVALSFSAAALYIQAPDTFSAQLQADGTPNDDGTPVRLSYYFSIPEGSKADIKYQTLGQTTTTSNLYKADNTFLASIGGSKGGAGQILYGQYEAGDYYFDVNLNGGGDIADMQFIFYDYFVPTISGGVLINWKPGKQDEVPFTMEDVDVMKIEMTPCPKAEYEFYDPDNRLVAKSAKRGIYPTMTLLKPKSGTWKMKVKNMETELPYSPLKLMYSGGKITAVEVEIIEEEEDEGPIELPFVEPPVEDDEEEVEQEKIEEEEITGETEDGEIEDPIEEDETDEKTEEPAEEEVSFDFNITEDNRIPTRLVLISDDDDELDTCGQINLESYLKDFDGNALGGQKRVFIRIPCEMKDKCDDYEYRDYTYYTGGRGGTDELSLDFYCKPEPGTYTVSTFFEGDATYQPSSKKKLISMKAYEAPGPDPLLETLKGIDDMLRDAGTPVSEACNRIPDLSIDQLLTENIKTGNEDADALINCIKDSLVEMADEELFSEIDINLIPAVGEVIGGMCLVAECAASEGYSVCIDSGLELTKMLAQQKRYEMLMEAFDTLDDVKKLNECFPKLTGFLASEAKRRITGIFRFGKSINLLDKFGDLDLHVYDDQGNHVGMNYETGEYENNIPGAVSFGDWEAAPELIYVPNNIDVKVSVDARDAELKEEEYTLELEKIEDGKAVMSESVKEKIIKGEIISHENEFTEQGIVLKQGVGHKKKSKAKWGLFVIALIFVIAFAAKYYGKKDKK